MFTKYRPTFKVNFHPPIGMQDLNLNDLPQNSRLEEVTFQEFVIKQDIQNNGNGRLWYMPFILIQLTLTFLSVGLLKIKVDLIYKKWHLPAHWLSCLIPTAIGLGMMLFFDNWFLIILGGLAVLIVNFGGLVLLTKRKKRHS